MIFVERILLLAKINLLVPEVHAGGAAKHGVNLSLVVQNEIGRQK
jgi:hypothetical protein